MYGELDHSERDVPIPRGSIDPIVPEWYSWPHHMLGLSMQHCNYYIDGHFSYKSQSTQPLLAFPARNSNSLDSPIVVSIAQHSFVLLIPYYVIHHFPNDLLFPMWFLSRFNSSTWVSHYTTQNYTFLWLFYQSWVSLNIWLWLMEILRKYLKSPWKIEKNQKNKSFKLHLSHFESWLALPKFAWFHLKQV